MNCVPVRKQCVASASSAHPSIIFEEPRPILGLALGLEAALEAAREEDVDVRDELVRRAASSSSSASN